MPLPIKVNGTGGQVAYLKLDHTTNNQNFANLINFPVSNIQFNYENQIIQRNSTVTKDTSVLAVDNSSKDAVKIYPNPVKNQLSVSGISRDQNFEIFSIDGKLIKKGSISSGKPVDVTSISKGIYIFKIDGKSIKFVKE